MEEKNKTDEQTATAEPETPAGEQASGGAETAEGGAAPGADDASAAADDKPVMDRFMTFLKEVGSRVQYEGGRAWMITNLRLEIVKIRRQKMKKLRELGERTFEMLESKQLEESELRVVYDGITALNGQITEKESHIEKLEAQIYEEQKKADGEGNGTDEKSTSEKPEKAKAAETSEPKDETPSGDSGIA